MPVDPTAFTPTMPSSIAASPPRASGLAETIGTRNSCAGKPVQIDAPPRDVFGQCLEIGTTIAGARNLLIEAIRRRGHRLRRRKGAAIRSRPRRARCLVTKVFDQGVHHPRGSAP